MEIAPSQHNQPQVNRVITTRAATKADSPLLAQISILASGGTFELLLQGLKRGISVHTVLEALCASEDTEYSYHYYQVIEVDGKFAGAVNYISVEDRYKLATNINPLLQAKFRFGIWQLFLFLRRARHLREMNTIKSPKQSLHINDIAVLPEFQGLGLGKQLVNFVINSAKQRNLQYVSLYVWSDNQRAIQMYQSLGFEIAGTAAVRPHKYLPHTSNHLMLLSI